MKLSVRVSLVYKAQGELDFAISPPNEDIPLYVDPFLLWKANLRSASIEDLTIGRLQVRELTVTGSLTAPATNLLGTPGDRPR